MNVRWLLSPVLIPVLILALSGPSACSNGGGDPDGGLRLPDSLSFSLTRPPVGEPPSAAEVTAFTRKITGFYKGVDFFRWCTWHSHGLHASYDPAMPDYALWWQDTRAIKAGDTVTFAHYGGADNLMIRTAKILSAAAAGYLASGDPIMRQLVIDYCKGTVALFQGLSMANENPEAPYVTARAIFTHNHSYTTADGRQVAVDYDPIKANGEKYDWNAHTVPNPGNPYFGDIWVRNMRSKDDVPHMWRVVPLLMRLVQDAPDEEVRAAAATALQYLQGFARDVVDQGYLIRTKEAGETYVPEEEESPGTVKDLASFVAFESYIPNAECDPKLTAALLAYGERLDNDCGDGISPTYEAAATTTHYFNYAIVRYFHLSAIANALILRQNRVAQHLLDGLVSRCDRLMAEQDKPLAHVEWYADLAAYLVASASSGLPLTGAEARLIQEQYAGSVDHYLAFPHWDLWDPAVADGEYSYIPSRDGLDDYRAVRLPEMGFLIEYCQSPFRNPAGEAVVDCAIVLDPTRWGE